MLKLLSIYDKALLVIALTIVLATMGCGVVSHAKTVIERANHSFSQITTVLEDAK